MNAQARQRRMRKAFGRLVRVAREHAHMTQEDLRAGLINLGEHCASTSRICHWENGRFAPNVAELWAIASVLKLDDARSLIPTQADLDTK